VYIITTRGNLNFSIGEPGAGYNNQYQFGDINQLKNQCPTEIAIFVHGWGNDKFKAKERLDRVKMSLENNNYSIPLIGFSWDSDKDWESVKLIAKENGPKLADFIIDYIDTCKHQHNKDTDIRLMGHSLGARAILSTLEHLHMNPTWNNNDYKITSVHLMGAAVDNEEVSKNSLDIDGDTTIKQAYGKAIEEEVVNFYNLYNTKDNVLQRQPFSQYGYIYQIYPFFEDDEALGQSGRDTIISTQDQVSTPPYYEINVQNNISAIRNADAMEDKHSLLCFDGFGRLIICERNLPGNYDFGLCGGFIGNYVCEIGIGDNHGGYIGFRDSNSINQLKDDGVINVVVNNWRNP
jgi:pimeloyl-ACP methyl ester carboxylesterase